MTSAIQDNVMSSVIYSEAPAPQGPLQRRASLGAAFVNLPDNVHQLIGARMRAVSSDATTAPRAKLPLDDVNALRATSRELRKKYATESHIEGQIKHIDKENFPKSFMLALDSLETSPAVTADQQRKLLAHLSQKTKFGQGNDYEQALDHLLNAIEKQPDEEQRRDLLCKKIFDAIDTLPPEKIERAIQRSLQAVESIACEKFRSSAFESLSCILKKIPVTLRPLIFEKFRQVANKFTEEFFLCNMLKGISWRLPQDTAQGTRQEAFMNILSDMKQIQDERYRADALSTLVGQIPIAEKEAPHSIEYKAMHSAIEALPSEYWREHCWRVVHAQRNALPEEAAQSFLSGINATPLLRGTWNAMQLP